MVTAFRGERYTDIVLEEAERTASNDVVLPSDGFDWLVIGVAVTAFTGNPVLTFRVKGELDLMAAGLPFLGVTEDLNNVGPFTITTPSVWVQTFGSINRVQILQGQASFETEFPLLTEPTLEIAHSNTDPATYSVIAFMGKGI